MHSETQSRAGKALACGVRLRDLPIGKTLAYQLIAQGVLKAKKINRVTVVTNWPEYLESRPPALLKGARS